MSRAFVVDDSSPIRNLVARMLQASGYEALEAGDGLAAVLAFPRLRGSGAPR